MLTYTIGRNLLGKLCGESSSDNLTLIDTIWNESIRDVITMKPWRFRDKQVIRSTFAGQQFYQLPPGRVNNVTITIGTTKYVPREIKSREEWDRINQSTAYSADIPQAFFVYDGQIGFWPKPANATTDAITVNMFQGHIDLSIADYTAGTITTATSAGTTIVGSGTSWTSQMAGRWIRITASNSTNTGDGKWYEISSVESTTSLTLVTPYEGSSISAGSATYTIGQTSIIPEMFQMVPVHRTVEEYFTFIQPDSDRAALAKNRYLEGIKRMQIELGGSTI